MPHTEIRQPSSRKRKRIPLDPSLQQVFLNKKEEPSMPGDMDQQRYDVDPDIILQNGIHEIPKNEL